VNLGNHMVNLVGIFSTAVLAHPVIPCQDFEPLLLECTGVVVMS